MLRSFSTKGRVRRRRGGIIYSVNDAIFIHRLILTGFGRLSSINAQSPSSCFCVIRGCQLFPGKGPLIASDEVGSRGEPAGLRSMGKLEPKKIGLNLSALHCVE